MANRFFIRVGLVLLTCIFVFCIYAFTLHTPQNSDDGLYCDTIHIGVLHITTSIPLFEFLKLLLHYRNSPIHFHFSVNQTSERMVRTLFETWRAPQVKISTYHTGSKLANSVRERIEIFLRPKLLQRTSRLIIMDADVLLTGAVDQLWNMFQETQVVGVVRDNQTEANVILVDLRKVSANTSIGESQQLYWNYMRQFTDSGVLRDIGHDVPPRFLSHCQDFGYISKAMYVSHCAKFPESKSKTYKRTTLLMIRHFHYAPRSSDVTLVTHLSYDKLPVFEEMCRRWRGPMSVTLYIAEENLDKALDFIEKSSVLHRRHNIAYHAVIARGRFYPTNLLRNVALRNVVTSHVFPLDVDFMPNLRLHEQLVPDLLKLATRHKALVVPAFAVKTFDATIPLILYELKAFWEEEMVTPFQLKEFAARHQPTDYDRLRSETEPYTVKWKRQYEPYVVVQSNVTEYDEMFFGYGHDRISHILELNAQGYEFLVLPSTFVVHKNHSGTFDSNTFKNPDYQACVRSIVAQHIAAVNVAYGTRYEFVF